MSNAWYAFYPGDYARDTSNLTMLEDSAYRRLLDYCYSTRQPIPTDERQVFMISRVHHWRERQAVRSILGKFFVKQADGWHNQRAEREMVRRHREYALVPPKISEHEGKPLAPDDTLVEGTSKVTLDAPSKYLGPPASLFESPEVQNDLPKNGCPQPQPQPEEKQKQKHVRVPMQIPPPLEDVKTYCVARQNQIDPQQWFDHYTSNGWMVGRTPMKDWKAAVRTWERNEYRNAKASQLDKTAEFLRRHGVRAAS